MKFSTDTARDVAALINQHRWAALATVVDGEPHASMIAYAPHPEGHGLLFFLSQLSPHTQHLLARPRCSLVISQTDDGQGDPQTLARLTQQGVVRVINRATPMFEQAKLAYCHCLPASEQLFGFGDFILFHFQPEHGRYVGGFAQSHKISAQQLALCYRVQADV